MLKSTRQEFSIKTCPMEDVCGLEIVLNAMSKKGYDLYSMHEGEINNKVVYNLIFVREIEIIDEEGDFEDIQGYKTKMEKMLYSKEEPYELCLNFQRKIQEKREKIENIKHFLEGAKENERDVLNEEIAKEVNSLNNLKKQLKSMLSPSKMASNLGEERLSINLSEEVYCLNEPASKCNLLAQTVKTRQELTNELGYIIPKVLFVENSELEEYSFTINIHAVPVVKGYVYPGHRMFYQDELNLKKYPKGSIKDFDILEGRESVWIRDESSKDFWAKGLEPAEYIAKYLKSYAVKHVNEIFNYQDLNRYIDIVSENNSLLVDNILGEFISLSELKYLLCELIREKVSVKDILYIFEKINDFVDETSKADLLDKVRISLSRQICWSFSNLEKEITGYEISENVIKLLENQASVDEDEEKGIVRIDGTKFEKFTKSLEQVYRGQNNVLVAPQHLRHIVFVLISQLFGDIPVICLEEVAPEFELKILGKV